ncbi:hypothetical protein LOK49_LG04G01763 [Camellia lanceoleosa]|uniref:Uncharacterized protein n=1 Tax=Camellia lanceoleosa TaxID=1840588 RepID=A0ACC0I1P7_9ERIC|nr:hypothetical protein LOK49_LG04G01763 [Camellia lanceoleosa]
MYAKDSGKHIEESKLKVILTSPSHSPVLLPTNGVKKQEPSYATSVQKDKLLSGVENLSPHVTNEQTVHEMLNLAIKYNKTMQEEDELPPEKLAIANVGRHDAKKHLEEHVSKLMSSNIIQTLGTMVGVVVF